jgi:threonine/homoserine/homoserine lactone efflux protein
MTFLQAAAFQWVNPKAWAMALTAATTYTPEGSTSGVFLVAGTFMLVGAPCSAAWAGFGQGMRRFLDRPPVLRAFNLYHGRPAGGLALSAGGRDPLRRRVEGGAARAGRSAGDAALVVAGLGPRITEP